MSAGHCKSESSYRDKLGDWYMCCAEQSPSSLWGPLGAKHIYSDGRSKHIWVNHGWHLAPQQQHDPVSCLCSRFFRPIVMFYCWPTSSCSKLWQEQVGRSFDGVNTATKFELWVLCSGEWSKTSIHSYCLLIWYNSAEHCPTMLPTNFVYFIKVFVHYLFSFFPTRDTKAE